VGLLIESVIALVIYLLEAGNFKIAREAGRPPPNEPHFPIRNPTNTTYPLI